MFTHLPVVRFLAAFCLISRALATPEGLLGSGSGSSPDPNSPSSPVSHKRVVAHYIVGNTRRYTEVEWERHITLAEQTGIDGFALNIGPTDWQLNQVNLALNAARGHDFAIYISLDMTVIPCAGSDHADIMSAISQYLGDPNYLKYDGKPLLSTFAGEWCQFGQGNPQDGWTYALSRVGQAVKFVPAFFASDGGFPESLSGVMDGGFNWNSAWPMGHYDINFDSDNNWINHLNGRTYMAGVSPWFFTHYSASSYGKNFIFDMDNWAVSERWEDLIEHRNEVDLAHIISWNDFGESHYIGPIDAAEEQPASEAWTTGYPHTDFLDLFAYYIRLFKTGNDKIATDRIFLWSRLSPAGADAPSDPVGPPAHREWTEDALWAQFFLVAPGDVTMECGPSQQTWPNMPAGIVKLKLALYSDCQVAVYVNRTLDGSSLEFTPTNFVFETQPSEYNFNVFVAASP